MDPLYGLPSLKEKSWDLCLTDPPYNVNAQPQSQAKPNSKNHNIGYNDNIEDYPTFSKRWFDESTRIAKFIIFTPGNTNIGLWNSIKPWREILFHYKKNGHGQTATIIQNKIDVILLYDKPNRRIMSNVYEIYLNNGFLRETDGFIHPHPKEVRLWKAIIKDVIPQSVLDPFIGSGTTAEVCEEMGIPWLGYEIMSEYIPDIRKRIERGIGKHKTYRKQTTLL